MSIYASWTHGNAVTVENPGVSPVGTMDGRRHGHQARPIGLLLNAGASGASANNLISQTIRHPFQRLKWEEAWALKLRDRFLLREQRSSLKTGTTFFSCPT